MPCRCGRPAMNSRRRASRHSAPSPASRPAESDSMFERLERVIPDPILGLMAAFRADPDPRKVDLGVGVYRDTQVHLARSEEHTSELQSRSDLVCRLLLEKKKKT